MVTRLMVIIFQCIKMSDHYVMHLELIEECISIAPQKGGKRTLEL